MADHFVVQLDIPVDGDIKDINITLRGPYAKWRARDVRQAILATADVPGMVTVASTKKLLSASGEKNDPITD